MVEIDAVYTGQRKCTLTHEEGLTLTTDAPRDTGGDASAFSPTDLVASGLATCILITIAIWAERHDLDVTGMTAHIVKEMQVGPRRIGRLPVTVHIAAVFPEEMRERLERIGHLCPVHASLHPEIDAPIEYVYDL